MQEEAMSHPEYIDMRTAEEIESNTAPVVVRLISFAESAMMLRAYIWSSDPILGFQMKCDLNKSIKENFDQHGIEIPFPYRNLIIKNIKDLNNYEKEN